MRILLDENIPWPLSRFLSGHTVTSVQREGWAGIQKDELLKKVEGSFDVLILADKNLRYQQDLRNQTVSIIELPTNRWPLLQGVYLPNTSPSRTVYRTARSALECGRFSCRLSRLPDVYIPKLPPPTDRKGANFRLPDPGGFLGVKCPYRAYILPLLFRN